MTGSVPKLIDRPALARARSRAARIGVEDFMLREASESVAHRLSAVNRSFSRGVVVDGRVPDALRHYAKEWEEIFVDDAETVNAPPERFDLALSILSLHAINDLPGMLIQIRRVLKPDGLFMGALFAGSTLEELKASLAAAEAEARGGASPRVVPFADVRDLGALMQRAGFALPVADLERTIVRYRKGGDLVRDLRAMGQSNVLAERSRLPLTRAIRDSAFAYYAQHHAEADGRLRATFEIVYLTGWAPHESQPKPLPPGSARMRLADALGTREHKASAGPTHRD